MAPGDTSVLVIIPAAGAGTRMASSVPKQYLLLGKAFGSVLEVSVKAMQQALPEATVVVAVQANDALIASQQLSGARILTTGGTTREETVYKTLSALKDTFPPDTLVFVHDAARALVLPDDVRKLKDAALLAMKKGAAGAVLAVRLPDTVKRVNKDGKITQDIERSGLVRIATPQVFAMKTLLSALSKNTDATDESSAVRSVGGQVHVVYGSPMNFKITEPADLHLAQRLLGNNMPTTRIGLGYDSHRFAVGRKLILGGVEIPYEKGLVGHSDADVLTHAVIDALLGAAHLGNIGRLFPDTDPAYLGADSVQLLKEVVRRTGQAGWHLVNLDAVLITEAPKINPYVAKIEATLAEALGADASVVSVKPKTNEKMGFEGRGEGISAQVTVLLERTDE